MEPLFSKTYLRSKYHRALANLSNEDLATLDHHATAMLSTTLRGEARAWTIHHYVAESLRRAGLDSKVKLEIKPFKAGQEAMRKKKKPSLAKQEAAGWVHEFVLRTLAARKALTDYVEKRQARYLGTRHPKDLELLNYGEIGRGIGVSKRVAQRLAHPQLRVRGVALAELVPIHGGHSASQKGVSVALRNRMYELHAQGHSAYRIAATLQEQGTPVARSAVFRWVKRFAAHDSATGGPWIPDLPTTPPDTGVS